MSVHLTSYKVEGLKKSNFIKKLLWYYTNIIIFKTGLFPFYTFKIILLKLFGAKIGKNIIIKPCINIKFPWNLMIGDNVWIGENVWIDNLTLITIGNNVCISQGAMLINGNHNYKSVNFDLMLQPIVIENGVWICAKSIVNGGVTVGENAVLLTGSVANNSLEANSIFQGVPAIKVRERIFNQ